MARPDYPAAKKAAPEYTRDTLHTVADLQDQIVKARNQK